MHAHTLARGTKKRSGGGVGSSRRQCPQACDELSARALAAIEGALSRKKSNWDRQAAQLAAAPGGTSPADLQRRSLNVLADMQGAVEVVSRSPPVARFINCIATTCPERGKELLVGWRRALPEPELNGVPVDELASGRVDAWKRALAAKFVRTQTAPARNASSSAQCIKERCGKQQEAVAARQRELQAQLLRHLTEAGRLAKEATNASTKGAKAAALAARAVVLEQTKAVVAEMMGSTAQHALMMCVANECTAQGRSMLRSLRTHLPQPELNAANIDAMSAEELQRALLAKTRSVIMHGMIQGKE